MQRRAACGRDYRDLGGEDGGFALHWGTAQGPPSGKFRGLPLKSFIRLQPEVSIIKSWSRKKRATIQKVSNREEFDSVDVFFCRTTGSIAPGPRLDNFLGSFFDDFMIFSNLCSNIRDSDLRKFILGAKARNMNFR